MLYAKSCIFCCWFVAVKSFIFKHYIISLWWWWWRLVLWQTQRRCTSHEILPHWLMAFWEGVMLLLCLVSVENSTTPAFPNLTWCHYSHCRCTPFSLHCFTLYNTSCLLQHKASSFYLINFLAIINQALSTSVLNLYWIWSWMIDFMLNELQYSTW